MHANLYALWGQDALCTDLGGKAPTHARGGGGGGAMTARVSGGCMHANVYAYWG